MDELNAATRSLLSESLGPITISGVTRLSGSPRTEVSRVRYLDPQGRPGSIVVKRYVEPAENTIREPATLRLLRGSGAAVARLVAESSTEPVILLTDLGEHPTLADHLLGGDRAAAESAVIGWAEVLGRLQADSTGMREKLRQEFLRSPAPVPPEVDDMPGVVAASCSQLPEHLETLGISWSEEAAEELRSISLLLEVEAPGAMGAVSPDDDCPDNAVATPDGVVLLDFEGGQFRHVAWDVAYLFVPWPSCWCAWRLPDDIASRAYEVWRGEAVKGIPAVTSPEFDTALIGARIAWSFVSVGWFLRSAVDGDAELHRSRPAGSSPHRRAVLQHRMAGVAALESTPFPTLRRLAEEVHSAMTSRWGDMALDVNPAFR